jgi:hypothetical protein
MSAGAVSFALPAVALCWQVQGSREHIGGATILLACAAVLAANFAYCGVNATL